MLLKVIPFLIVLCIINEISNAQNTVSGTVQNIPSKTIPSEAKITLTNTSNGNKYAQRTRNGTFSITDVPNGTYEEKIEVVGDYTIQGTISVAGNKVLSERLMEDKPLTSQMYLDANKTLLFFFKNLTGTMDDSPRGTLLIRAQNPHMRLFARNYDPNDPISMPLEFRHFVDSALLSYTRDTEGIVSFREEFTDSLGGIVFKFMPHDQMPSGAYGYWDAVNLYDFSYLLFDRYYVLHEQFQDRNTWVVMHEIAHALGIFMNGADLKMVCSHEDQSATKLHPDEAEVLKRVFTLDIGTDMGRYKDVVVTGISNVLPQAITFSAPINNATITYDVNGNIVINYNSIPLRDGDGERARIVARLRGNGLDQYITDMDNDGIILVPKAIFEPLKQYTLEGMTISGFDTIPATNIITFNTPQNANVPPTTPILVTPANNGIIAPNQSNTFKWKKSIDTDPVAYTLAVFGSGLNLVYNNLTDTIFALPANTLIQNKPYSWKVTATDGKANTESTTRNITTSNLAPGAFTLVTPANNTIIHPSQANTFKWKKSKDDDALTYKLNITGNGLNLAYDNLTDTIYAVPANIFTENKTYTWNVQATDGQANTNSNSLNFIIDNIPPGTFNIIKPNNEENIDVSKDTEYKWSKSKDADQIQYTIEFSDPQNTKTTFSNITDTIYIVPKNTLTEGIAYTVKVTASDGQAITQAQVITMNTITRIEDGIVPGDGIKLYPNPASSYIIIKLPTNSPGSIHIEIYDILGTLCKEYIHENTIGDYFKKIDVSSYQPGIYFLDIEYNKTHKQIKFIKE